MRVIVVVNFGHSERSGFFLHVTDGN